MLAFLSRRMPANAGMRKKRSARREFGRALEHVSTKLNQLRCVVARRTARRAAKSDAAPSVERRNAASARHGATLRAGAFCDAGSSQGLPVGAATRFALLLPAAQNSSGATGSTWSEHALERAERRSPSLDRLRRRAERVERIARGLRLLDRDGAKAKEIARAGLTGLP